MSDILIGTLGSVTIFMVFLIFSQKLEYNMNILDLKLKLDAEKVKYNNLINEYNDLVDEYNKLNNKLNKNEHMNALYLDNGASEKEIKEQYRELAKLYHPDINPKYAEKFKKITAAYNAIMRK